MWKMISMPNPTKSSHFWSSERSLSAAKLIAGEYANGEWLDGERFGLAMAGTGGRNRPHGRGRSDRVRLVMQ